MLVNVLRTGGPRLRFLVRSHNQRSGVSHNQQSAFFIPNPVYASGLNFAGATPARIPLLCTPEDDSNLRCDDPLPEGSFAFISPQGARYYSVCWTPAAAGGEPSVADTMRSEDRAEIQD